ncbi:tRNA (guanosine(46)-N7)-methyltransferase TrmB [Thiomicrorhabdus xiamenensis]|uniref:tRNA (guanine-N(7)-)-methyltransferase n=1 Tax=Thiomicrorhabdus xiamenensis TaxID=2739063 RepID=A0A7D4P079_9GAMM|nr:tRNA (guanosine(46)-N7)-methyltransferase TrmB [Thiomicrorhabdus xiamenensis]QKI90098.1 tRNA (guanosine(46)-N7)-methyltransferase TrmB [Thiomicrorhabdus xiamenensis]
MSKETENQNTETAPQQTAETAKPEKYSTRIRSFALRQGRLTASQEKALNEHWPEFGLEVKNGMLDFSEVFGRQAPTIVEIGFGMGKSLAEMAEANPHNNYIGVEVHKPGVGALLKLIEEKKLSNVRIFNHDAIEVLEQCIPKDSLDGVYLFFPDPWHKKRHHKRRIVQPAFAATIAEHLKIGGQFHMATDWENYSEHMMEVMSEAPAYRNVSGKGQFTPRPDYRPLTKFEQRGHRLGHGVWDLIFERV